MLLHVSNLQYQSSTCSLEESASRINSTVFLLLRYMFSYISYCLHQPLHWSPSHPSLLISGTHQMSSTSLLVTIIFLPMNDSHRLSFQVPIFALVMYCISILLIFSICSLSTFKFSLFLFFGNLLSIFISFSICFAQFVWRVWGKSPKRFIERHNVHGKLSHCSFYL